ncbi:hypothetical protein ABTI18_07760 [Acinetobacter baumannii]|uniref:hypothetical protein n=1 Tax=Acinetobacter baumannii TaxID=470 RepID=UPI00112B46AE|nr:hypothetical protein [Acinetobacter baumannii]MDC4595766.1 hypothetical protein [Acinetobacter baumannii]MDC5607523.1 hypothetical protein [Acinetobacter baumannii]MDO7408105.1 hypothetical protein [Acinetobacter baumannii]TPU42005.1 hypothetical protein FJU99_06045 [Acinetobacter baumannii]HEO1827232.1 hypothetical protein [Acinetobacter baumannii]
MKKIIVISTILLSLSGCAIPAVNNLVRSTNMYQDDVSGNTANLRVYRSNIPMVQFYITYQNNEGEKFSKNLITKQISNNLTKYGSLHEPKRLNMPKPTISLNNGEEFFEFKVPANKKLTFRLTSVIGSTTMYSCDVKKDYQLERNANYELIRFKQIKDIVNPPFLIEPSQDGSYCKFVVKEIFEDGKETIIKSIS